YHRRWRLSGRRREGRRRAVQCGQGQEEGQQVVAGHEYDQGRPEKRARLQIRYQQDPVGSRQVLGERAAPGRKPGGRTIAPTRAAARQCGIASSVSIRRLSITTTFSANVTTSPSSTMRSR